MTTYLPIERTCPRCGRTFRVPARQPGRTVCFRHAGIRPDYERIDRSAAVRENAEAQCKLDRQITLGSAHRELEDLTQRIDAIDDQIASLRAEKEASVARHLILSGLVDCLQALLSGTEAEYVRELQQPDGPAPPGGTERAKQ